MKYVSMLRGINVAGQKKIKMADLKTLYEGLGFEDVMTYIQSGNVVFQAKDNINHQALIEQAIQDKYGFDVAVFICTQQDIKHIIEACPFGEIDLQQDGTKVLATLLSASPQDEMMASVLPFKHESESFVLDGEVAYIKCPNGYGKTKLSNVFLEKKLKVAATTRNWKTMVKLQELLRG